MPIRPSPRYRRGKVCPKHPELNGERRGSKCVPCAQELRRIRRQNKPNFGLTMQLRAKVARALKSGRESASVAALIGCTVAQGRKYLARKFKRGMAWANHGRDTWHIDHILPCSSFDLTDPAQQRVCCHYRNLQPLWAIDNLRKRTKVPG